MKFKKARFYNDDNQNMRLRGKNGARKHVQELVPIAKVSAALFKPEGGGIGDGRQITGTTSAFEKSKVFRENHNICQMGILNPDSHIIRLWNRVFLFSCLVALFIDPLFFYLPEQLNQSDSSMCLTTDMNLQIVITCFRTIADIFYGLNIFAKFQTAYVLPSSIVSGRGELVMDRRMIAWRYLGSEFFRDVLAALPILQILMWGIFPITQGSKLEVADNLIVLVVFLQYIPRLYLILPLSSQIIKTTGIITQTAWGGAAYNLLLYMLASHVLGASWYFLSFARYTTCLRSECKQENNNTGICLRSLYCTPTPQANTSVVFSNCNAGNKDSTFHFGIFASALQNNVTTTAFIEKYLYCLWFGLQNLSCYGQNLTTTTYIGETSYAILIGVMGLVLFAHLIGNMQTYLQSLSGRLEEWRLKRRDTEEWMEHRQLPKDLRVRVRRFVQYKWLATRGVNEDSILKDLPADLLRDIQRHLCLELLLRVPLFSQMDGQLLDAISERLMSSLSIQGTYIVREGDPVTEMLFIIRGRLDSSTTNGGLTGFFNLITLGPGDFCGEELLTWALLPKSSLNLPSSTRTVKAFDEVEAFALQAEDLKFVANQFRRLHSKKIQHAFRFYSHQWRTWAACFIQAAWRRHKKRMMAEKLSTRDSFSYSRGKQVAEETEHDVEEHPFASSPRSQANQNLRARILASRFAANTRRGAEMLRHIQLPKLPKPEEPDFSMELDD